MLLLSGTADPVGDYGRGVRKTYDSLKAAGMSRLQMKLYEGGRHELLNETNRNAVAEDIYKWIEETVLQDKRQE